MNLDLKLILSFSVVVVLFGTTPAEALNEELAFHWAPCPMVDTEGNPCAAATSYEVQVAIYGSFRSVLVVTVPDTTYTLTADEKSTYRLRVRGLDAQGRPSPFSEWSAEASLDRLTPTETPHRSRLLPAYPNPFNPSTRLGYHIAADLPPTARVSLRIHDLQGRVVRTFEIDRSAGEHSVRWHGRDDTGQAVAASIYLTRFICGDVMQTGKLTLVK